MHIIMTTAFSSQTKEVQCDTPVNEVVCSWQAQSCPLTIAPEHGAQFEQTAVFFDPYVFSGSWN
jgi:hypothetical protein